MSRERRGGGPQNALCNAGMSSALHLSAGLVYMGSAQQISTGERRIKDTQDQHWEDIQQNRNKLRASSSRRLFFFLALGSHLLRVRWYHKHHCIHFVSISRLGDHITSGRRSGILVRRPCDLRAVFTCAAWAARDQVVRHCGSSVSGVTAVLKDGVGKLLGVAE